MSSPNASATPQTSSPTEASEGTTNPTQAAAPNATLDQQAHLERLAQGEAIIRRDVLWSLGAGAVPIPGVDVAAVMAVQVKLLRELSELYGAKFSEGIAKKLIYSLLGSIGAVGIGSVIGGSLTKLVPVLGTALGVISVPVVAGAFTHTLGRILLLHLEAGGTLLTLDPVAMRKYFKQEFEKAKQTVAELRKDTAKGSTKAP